MNKGNSTNEAMRKVIMALLKTKGMSQRQLAIELDTSPSNLNQRINAGSMKPDMILKLDQVLATDVLAFVQRLESGEKWNAILKDIEANKTHIPSAVKNYEKLINDQQRKIWQLEEQVDTLIRAIDRLQRDKA